MKSEERFEMILTVTANAAIDKRYVRSALAQEM